MENSYTYDILVGGLEHLDYFSIQLGIIIPTDFNSIIFQRGRLNHQPDDVLRILDVDHYPIQF